jgi:autophagy-related protein 13
MLTEGGAGGSSGSLHTDDDNNISDFLKMLDLKKHLKSFEPAADGAADASTRRTSAALMRFQRMRDSNAALSDSMSSSMLLNRSSSSSSRQLSSVPQMVAGTSISTSSSPGKPVSPHTPHTPAIPSRLSANSIAEYSQPHRSRDSTSRHSTRRGPESHDEDDNTSESTARDAGNGTTAIDIPVSPHPYPQHNRRSSSVAQQNRALVVEDETDDQLPFHMRSMSLGAADRPPLSLSALLGSQEASQQPLAPDDDDDEGERILSAAANVDVADNLAIGQDPSSSYGSREDSVSASRGISTVSPYRPRPAVSGRGVVSRPPGSFSSVPGDRGSGASIERPSSGRYSFNSQNRGADEADDELLLFAMSEIQGHNQGRRSIEEARRTGGDAGNGGRRGMGRRGGPWG